MKVKNQACEKLHPDLEMAMVIPADTVHYSSATCKGAVETQPVPACSCRQLSTNFCFSNP